MIDIAQNTEHATEAIARLIQQYKDKPRIEAFINALSARVQDLEDTLYDILVESAIANATGTQLDDIGDIVGQQRQGMLDAEYRTFVRARVKANRSSGRLEELIEILKLILDGQTVPPTSSILTRDAYPASVVIEATGVVSNTLIIWRDFLNRAKAAGIRLGFISNSEEDDAFIADDSEGSLSLADTHFCSDSAGDFDGGETSCSW
jgi:hypothetical protein